MLRRTGVGSSPVARASLGVTLVLAASCHGGASGPTQGPGGTLTGPPGTLSVWTQGVGTKVQPTTAPGSGTSISVASARKAWASSQLVVHGDKGYVKDVSVSLAEDLSDGAGHTLAKKNVTFFLEYFIDFTGVEATPGNVPVPENSPTKDGQIPDPLVPLVDPYTGKNAGQPFNVPGNSNQPIFVDVFVPGGTAAGTYTGKVHVAADGGLGSDVPISVTVWDLDLPDQNSVTTHFKMSVNSLLTYHNGLAKCGGGGDCYLGDNPQALTVVKRYEELVHDHRITIQPQFVVDPVDGCKVPTSWSAYDSAMEPYLTGSYFGDGVPISSFDVPFSPGEDFGLDGCTQSQYAAIAKAWATHLKSKGWFDKSVVYAFDEPPNCSESPCDPVFEKIAQSSSWLQEGDSEWKSRTMDTTSPSEASAALLNDALGIYTVNLPWYDNWYDHGAFYGREQWSSLFSQGIKLWFYESNSVVPPYPTFATNTTDGLEPVMAMWGSWAEQATGFLYWDISNWDADNSWGPSIAFGMTGDGVLIYPGNHDGTSSPAGSPSNVAIDGPIPSYRLKMVRNGLQDWALFRLADEKGLTSLVKEQIGTVYHQLGGCTYDGCPKPAGGFFWKDDEAAMDRIRETVAKAIVGG